jgi:hypothetical protein
VAIFTPEAWLSLTAPFRRGAGAVGPTLAWLAGPLLTAALTVGLLLLVTHGCHPPGPGPVPPNPPGPVPPAPPGPVAGMHVLLTYETAELSKLPPAQLDVLYATAVRAYLDARTAPSPDGKAHEWRMWDKDVDPTNDEPVWKTLLARPHATLPWLVVAGGDGKVAFEGPLPADVDATLALLKKYGGP